MEMFDLSFTIKPKIGHGSVTMEGFVQPVYFKEVCGNLNIEVCVNWFSLRFRTSDKAVLLLRGIVGASCIATRQNLYLGNFQLKVSTGSTFPHNLPYIPTTCELRSIPYMSKYAVFLEVLSDFEGIRYMEIMSRIRGNASLSRWLHLEAQNQYIREVTI